MMAQPAAATIALPAAVTAAGSAALPVAAEGAPGELPLAPSAAVSEPFAQALLALNCSNRDGGRPELPLPEPGAIGGTAELAAPASAATPAISAASAVAGAPATAAAPTTAAAPVAAAALAMAAGAGMPIQWAGGESSLAGLLRALCAADWVPASPGLPASQEKARGSSERDLADAGAVAETAAAEADSVKVTTADPSAALLAVVLQWLQQQGVPVVRDTDSQNAEGRDNDGIGAAGLAQLAAAVGSPLATDPDAAALQRAILIPGAQASPAAMPGAPSTELLTDWHNPEGQQGRGGRAPMAMPSVANQAAGAGMDLAQALRAAAAANPGPTERSIAVPVHERHWPQALAAQLLILSGEKVQAATLRLSPEHLGPVEVHIDLQDTHVNVVFAATHAETRAALEQAMPQLRAVLADAGVTLGQATVQQQARRESQNSAAGAHGGRSALDQPEASVALARVLGMVDEYV